MSSELERRLAQSFRRLPRPSRDSERRARAAALAALPAAPPRRVSSRRPLGIAVALVGVLVLGAAAALAASGTVTIRFHEVRRAVPRTVLAVPRGTNGIAMVAGGRLWLAARDGARVERFAAQTVALSPHALYVAVGVGRSLVVMSPQGRTAWAHRADGNVVAIAWAPSGLRIAYVTRSSQGFQLRTIEGDGDHDRLLDASVRPIRPSWRADSLAVAYVGGGGRPVVYDWRRDSRARVPASCGGSVAGVAFAPSGTSLAVATSRGLALHAGVHGSCFSFGASPLGPAWFGDRLAVGVGSSLRTFRSVGTRLVPTGTRAADGRLQAVAAAGETLLYAYGRDGHVRVDAMGGADVVDAAESREVAALDVR